MFQRTGQRPNSFTRATAVVLLGHLLLGLVMAASPSLHHFLHRDSDTDGHVCFVTTFGHGGCDAPGETVVVAIVVPEVVGEIPAPAAGWVESIFQTGGVFEHAPPALLS